MKTAVKLVFIYYACQILGWGVFLVGMQLALAVFFGIVMMCLYLWKSGYISTKKEEWSLVSGKYLALTVVIYFTGAIVINYSIGLLPELPDLMKASFEDLQSDWTGILCIALFGPVLEELLFRGAITKVLLKKYDPVKAIILSGVVFGVFHINPAQILFAMLIGILLGWIYYRTASLVPCILVHVLNNSLSVYMSLKYPEMKNMDEFFSGNATLTVVIAAVLFVGVFFWMRSIPVPHDL